MSEQEKKSGGTAAGGSSVVMVESAGSRHKQPYRPTELHESPPELHHKRSKAPAVPSAVTEELKEVTESAEDKERKESERAMSSEKIKHSIAKKLSSNTKRRGSSPEAITLAPLEVEMKKGTVSPPPQPIPPQVASVASAADLAGAKTGAEKKADDDSITEEIAELRTPEVAKRSSEWQNDKVCDNNKDTPVNDQDIGIHVQVEKHRELFKEIIIPIKKKEISWNDKEYLKNVHLQEIGVKSQALMLERKASIGPCFRQGTAFGGPSGITICVPKKSLKNIVEDLKTLRSVINITVSKKCLLNKSISQIVNEHGEEPVNRQETEKNPNLQAPDVPGVNCLGLLRSKISCVRSKIRNVMNM